MKLVFDLEGTSLLDHTSIDYTASPYRLLPEFRVHCLVAKDIDSKKKFRFVDVIHGPQHDGGIHDFKEVLKKTTTLIGHNIIDYDLLVLKLYGVIDDYIVAENWRECLLLIDGVSYPMAIFDTLVVSKTMNPDRYGGHSLDEWGKRVGVHKIDWRGEAIALGLIEANAPRGAEFKTYHPKMLEYNEQDVDTNEAVYFKLLEEWGDWKWDGAFSLEQQVRDIVTRQQHRGFWYNTQLAEESVRDLDQRMEEIRAIVEPLIPAKPLGVTKLKQYVPPKIQFKKNGEPSAMIQKWIEKHGGTMSKDEIGNWWAKSLYGADYELPMDAEKAVQTHEPATVKDTTHIKGWLVEMGWKPTQYKERDLTCDTKKNKLTPEKFKAAVERYVEQTLESPFCKDRCSELDVSPRMMMAKLLKHDLKRPLKVYTNPTITVGMEKEIDPALLELSDQFPHAKLVSDFLTYSHRRNSILGGGQEVFDDDDRDDEDEYAGKGFLAAERISIDGRIPTPADTCGAGTSRFKHRLVANIPRVTSLYGKEMRGQFGVTRATHIQLGYDFDSLEAKIEAHYVFRYAGGPEYGVSLIAEKPNDCHTVLAKAITAILAPRKPEGWAFPRSTAKNVKYGCSYNAQVARVAKTVGCSLDEAAVIFNAFWEQAAPLKELKEAMQKYWETTGQKKFLLGIDGRKLPIRSKGNVINTAFQSAGVICAKRAMVIHERMLRQEGMFVDFFRDDWRNHPGYCQQLIAYHDEAQLEVLRGMVKWKKFETEDACKSFKSDDGKVWSDPVHNDRGWFRGYCRAGELATIAVREAGEFYKLNVQLSAGYMLGTDWASCH